MPCENGTIFPKLSIDRKVSRWETQLETLTPVERRGSLYFKREDYFAPLGYGGINGAKVRQIVWLVSRYIRALPKTATPGLILAASVKSPQLGRVAAVARHFNIPALMVIGSQVHRAVVHNENVRIAVALGASFVTAKVAYNPVLQKVARDVHASPEFRDSYLLEYGLSVEGDDVRVESFYRFCGEQVRNIPDDVHTLLMPAGSCNSTIAVLYGLARHPKKNLKRIILFGIGPTRIDFYEERLRRLGRVSGLPVAESFIREYVHHPDLQEKYGTEGVWKRYWLLHYDLHSSGFASYQDEMPETYEGVALHPTYEGKMLRYIQQHVELRPYLTDSRSLFWVVGSEPKWSAMESSLLRRWAK